MLCNIVALADAPVEARTGGVTAQTRGGAIVVQCIAGDGLPGSLPVSYHLIHIGGFMCRKHTDCTFDARLTVCRGIRQIHLIAF
jgi:hypothetical protein